MGMSYGHCSKCHRVLEDTNGVCLITYFLIDGKPVCKECAKKMKGDYESYLNGLNMVGEISYSQYSELYDEGTKQIQKAYELGKAEKNTELENKIADIKANCDLAIEGRDVKVMELEKENERLTVSYETLKLHDEEEIGILKSENAKLKDEWQEQVQKAIDEGYARTLQTMQLTKSKEIIKNLLSAYTTYADSFDDRDNEIVDEAEQFLNSEPQSKWINPARTTNDNEIKLNSEVEK